jgi:hypothetical protein
VGIRKSIAVNASLLNQVASEPGVTFLAREESGGCPVYWPGGVRRRGDESLVCGFRMERGMARSDTVALLGWREGDLQAEAPRGVEYRRGVRLADRFVVVMKAL